MTSFPQRLISGYQTFATQRLPTEQTRYRDLSERGQSPEVMVIGCCDSRVSPEVIFDAGPGELFVVRNVANLVPPYSPDGQLHGVSAALEFAVQVLRVKHIVVLGHAQCGGVKAFVEDGEPLSPGDFIGRWMLKSSARAVPTSRCRTSSPASNTPPSAAASRT
jgi:carbonic anhydrase